MDHGELFLEPTRVQLSAHYATDDNRGHLLEAGLPQAIVSLLEGYAESIPVGAPIEPLSLSIPHLKVLRTAIGVLLNASIGYGVIRLSVSNANPLKYFSRRH
jgi:hypothetical protein